MAINIERLLRMTADFHSFCSDDHTKNMSANQDEMTVEELDLVAAATGMPPKIPCRREEDHTTF